MPDSLSAAAPPELAGVRPEPLSGIQIVGLLAGPLFFLLLCFGPAPEGMTVAGQRALGIMALCATWWLTTPVALPVTSLLGLALLPVMGVLDKNRAMELFGNQSVFFVIASFVVAAVTVRTGLSTRVALWALRRSGKSEDAVAIGTMLVAAALTSVVISHAVAALLLPIVIEIVRALNLGPGSRFARRLLLSMAWGTICGSNISLLSCARSSLSIGMFAAWQEKNGGGSPIGFFEFSAATFLPVIASLVIAAVALRLFHRPEGLRMDAAVDRLSLRLREMGGMSRGEWITAAVLVTMVAGFILFGKSVGLGTIALLGAALLFVVRAAHWEETEGQVNWGVALLYGGAIAVAAAIDETGAVGVLVHEYLPLHSIPVWILVLLCTLVTIVITAFVSNAAAIALVLPICITIATEVGINPRAMAVLLPVAAGLDFSLPVSTPAMAMVFGTGYLRTQDSVIPGVITSVIGAAVTVILAWIVWPALGLPLVGE